MALSTSITLTVSDYDMKMSRSLKFYKNDALKLIFTINYWGIDNAHGIPQKVLMPLEALSAVLFMETPDGTDSVEAGAVEGNVVTFYLNSEYTQNVGVSRMQIRLFDDDGCAITLPEFPFEIKENIYGGTDVNFKNVVLMDNSGNTIITEDFNQIDVGDVFLYGVEPIESVLYKEINDLELVENLDGTEDLIIQLNDGSTKRTKASEFLSAEVDLTGYATETYVQTKIAEASLSGGEVDLSGYVTEDELNLSLATKANKSELHTHANKTVLDGITSTKVTEWNNKSNFDGNYNSLTNKPIIPTVDVNKNYVDTQLATKANKSEIPSLNGYATETYVQNKIAEASLSGGEVDLSNYATKDELSTKADKTELHSHSNKTVLDGITSTKVNEWNNKSNFDGNYNSLTNKPTIPTVPTNISSFTNDAGYLSSTVIKSIMIVDALPEVEAEGVLYLVRGGTSTDTPTTPEEPTVTNLYPNQSKSTTSDGFTITFTGRNVTIDGRNDTASIQCQTNQFDMALEANKAYYLKLTNVSGLFDDSKRVSQSDGMICMVALTVYDSSGTSTNLINWDERDARGIYEKFTFTPSSACVKGKLIIQAKKLTSFSNWTCSIVIAEEGV